MAGDSIVSSQGLARFETGQLYMSIAPVTSAPAKLAGLPDGISGQAVHEQLERILAPIRARKGLVLEIAAGSGYHAAVFAKATVTVGRVYLPIV